MISGSPLQLVLQLGEVLVHRKLCICNNHLAVALNKTAAYVCNEY